MSTQSIALFSIKGSQLCVRFIRGDDASTNESAQPTAYADSQIQKAADFVWHSDSGRFYGLVLSNSNWAQDGWYQVENGNGNGGGGFFAAVLGLGSDLQISTISRLSLDADSPKYCGLLLTSGVLSATVSSGRRIQGQGQQPQFDPHNWPGFCMQVTEQTHVAELPNDGQRKWSNQYRVPVDYSNQFAFREFRTAIPLQVGQQQNRDWALGARQNGTPGRLLYLANSNKVYAVRYEQDDSKSMTLFSMPRYCFDRLSTTSDYYWSSIRIVTDDNHRTNDGCSIIVQGKDPKSPPRLYSFFINDNRQVWFFCIPLQGTNRVYGELDIPLGSQRYSAQGMNTVGGAIPSYGAAPPEAERGTPLKVVHCQGRLCIFYSWQKRPAWINIRLNDDASFNSIIRCENISPDEEFMAGACVVPSNIVPP